MERSKKAAKKVESIRHKDKRANIPTEELRDFVAASLQSCIFWTGLAHSSIGMRR